MAGAKIEARITARDTATPVMRNFGSTVTTMNQGFELMSKALGAVTAPFKSVIEEGSGFSAQMSAVAAISKTTAEEFKKLSDEAQRIGETTTFTAIEAGRAMEELKRAGMDTAGVLATTAQAMDLAAATGTDLATSARVTAVQMNIFKTSGLAAKEAVDLMVQTVSASPQNFSDLTYAMDYSAGTASAMGMNFQDLTSILGAMAEAGVRGSKAGTALNTALARLSKPSKQANVALMNYGISLDQINPATTKFSDIVDLLNERQVTQKDLFTILGVVTAPKFFKVIEAGGDVIRGFADKQKQANTASEAARIRLDNLTGDTIMFGSAMSGLKINIFASLDGLLRGVVQTATRMVSAFSSFVKDNKAPMRTFFESMRTAIDDVKEAITPLVRGFGSLLIAIGYIIKSEAMLDLLDTLEDTMISVWDNGIKPLARAISDFIKEFVKIVTSNKNVVEAFKNLQTIIGKVINIIATIVTKVLGTIITEILKFGGVIVDFIKNNMEPWIDAFAEVVKFITDVLIVALDLVIKTLDDLEKGIDPFAGFFDTLKEKIQGVVTPVQALAKGLKELIGVNVTDVISKNIRSLDTLGGTTGSVSDKVVELARDIRGPLASGFSSAITSVADFAGSIVGADEASKDLSYTLVGNTLSVDAITTGNAFITAGTDLQNFGRDAKDVDEASKDLDATLENIADTLETIPDAIPAVAMPSIPVRPPAPVTATLPAGRAEEDREIGVGGAASQIGSAIGGRITGVGGAISGFQSGGVGGAIAGAVTELLLSNEKFAAGLEGLSAIIQEVLAPVIEAIAPLLKSVGNVLRRLTPIVERFVPLLNTLVLLVDHALVLLEPMLMSIDDLLEKIQTLTIVTDSLKMVVSSLEQILRGLIEVLTAVLGSLSALAGSVQILASSLAELKEAVVLLIGSVTQVLEPIQSLSGALDQLRGVVAQMMEPLRALATPLEQLRRAFTPLTEGIRILVDPLNRLAGVIRSFNPFGGGGIGGMFGFQSGTDTLTKSQLLRLPGMEEGSGLIKAHVGETVSSAGAAAAPVNITFNVKAIRPTEQVEEIRQLIETLSLTGRLRLSNA